MNTSLLNVQGNIKKVSFGSQEYQPAKPALKALSFGKDLISFTSSKPIFKRHGIDPDKVKVESQFDIDRDTKIMLLEKVLEAHEHAVKNKTKGNYSGRCYATNMKLNNGQWTLATNIEISNETVLCGERSALVRAWNNDLEALPVITDANREEIAAKGQPKVEYLAMSSYKPPKTDPGCGNPCSECLNWINTDRFFSKNTRFASVYPGPDGNIILKVRPVTELLPYWGENGPSKTDKDIMKLDLNISERAKAAMAKHDINPVKLNEAVKAAKEAYENGVTAELSDDHNVGAAALLDPGDIIMQGERMEWTRRWVTPPELLAATKGFQLLTKAINAARDGVTNLAKFVNLLPEGTDTDHFLKELGEQKDGEARVNAVAYYGDDKVPYLDNLGKLSQGRGDGDTLIVNIKDDKIQVNTILDYMPHVYISSKKKK